MRRTRLVRQQCVEASWRRRGRAGRIVCTCGKSRPTKRNLPHPVACIGGRSIRSNAARETSRLSRLRVFVSRDGPLASSRKNRVCSRSDWHGSLFCRCPAPTRRKHTPRHMHTLTHAAQPAHARFAAAPAYRTEQSASDEHQTRHAAQREQAVDDVADDTMDLRTRRRRESGRRSEQLARRAAVKHAHS